MEVQVTDVGGFTHRIVEKVPVLAAAAWSPTAPGPTVIWIDAEVVEFGSDAALVTFGHHIETVDGTRTVRVPRGDVEFGTM